MYFKEKAPLFQGAFYLKIYDIRKKQEKGGKMFF